MASGVGKTTVATGLMAALRAKGARVAAAKVGPDFIDPGYHALATGRPGRNLDSWICGEAAVAPLAARAALDSDVLVVEGVMGLFDGAAGDGPDASTASIARHLEAPIVLVVDASALSRSVAALVHGYASFQPGTSLAGVILNRVGSAGHEILLRDALAPLGLPVLGALPRDPALTWRDRHLGLVPVAEHPADARAALDRLAEVVADHVDLAALMKLGRGAPERSVGAPALPARAGRARVAVAGGPAFTFLYRDNLEALEAAGAELLPFDPLTQRALPEGADALYVGGGFPEVYAGALADNRELLADVRDRIASGLVTWAECGGLLWLARSLDGRSLAGIVPADARMTARLSLGYRTATAREDTPVAAAGTMLRGHEFHYSELDP
ncbi:MAG TPA: cobyrinate a,c-diamide synthase, partial [Acidimicrobiales bacterium]|nr:cobyrinate a,c-diamide synthase [Acidimicrobiales bacterium]